MIIINNAKNVSRIIFYPKIISAINVNVMFKTVVNVIVIILRFAFYVINHMTYLKILVYVLKIVIKQIIQHSQ